MFREAILHDEPARLAAVERYGIIDTPSEPEFDRLARLIKSVYGAPIVLISLIDDRRQWIKSGIGADFREVPRSQTFCDHAIRASDVMAVPDATRDDRFRNHPFVVGAPHFRSYLGGPLRSPDGYNVGTVCVVDMKPREFTPDEIDILRQFADVAITQFELRQIASRDALTGVLTRRAFEEAVAKEMARHKRYGAPASLALFDLDRFKSINDRFGHPVGDAVLRAAIDACRDIIRGEEVIGRLGGEEFGVLFVNTSGDEALIAAERFRNAIASATIEAQPGLAFTASFGIADLESMYETPLRWIAAADAALYRAKAGGRNCCECA